jgi:hypothetical protein
VQWIVPDRDAMMAEAEKRAPNWTGQGVLSAVGRRRPADPGTGLVTR